MREPQPWLTARRRAALIRLPALALLGVAGAICGGDAAPLIVGAEAPPASACPRVGLIEIYYASKSIAPRWESTLSLVTAFELMRDNPALRIEVRGHTDGVGTTPDNAKLSFRRARAIALWLTGHGIAAGRLSVTAFGGTSPIAGNGSAEGRARNRRVELLPACPPLGRPPDLRD